MLKSIGKGLLSRLLAYAFFGVGFWVLIQGFLRPNVLLGLLGGVMIPLGLFLIVKSRQVSTLTADLPPDDNHKEDDKSDPLDGSR